jgi:hypothetical protein
MATASVENETPNSAHSPINSALVSAAIGRLSSLLHSKQRGAAVGGGAEIVDCCGTIGPVCGLF